MDPVSAVLAEQERRPQRFLPFVVLAVALHGAVALTAFVVARAKPQRPAKLPAVSVRIVRPQLPGPPAVAAGPAAPVERPAARPQASPVPKPRATPPPKASPVTRSERRASSEQAMPATRTTPMPAPEPAPAGGGGGRGGSGLLVEGSGANGIPGVPADFQFTFYVERMLALVESVWYRPPATGATRARVRFTIARNGRLEGIQLEESSGVPSFDRAALRALYAANPLPPLPPAYAKPTLTVHLTFAE